MTAKSLNKIKFLLIALLFVFMASVFCFTDFARADDFLISELSLTMEKDAKYFHDEKSGKFGMQFTATLNGDDYDALNSQLKTGAYEDLEYGVIILPKYYTEIYPVNEETVFSNTAVYDYANHDGNTWVYSGNKIRIVNINANDWVDEGDFYTYSGAVVDIKDGSEKYGYVNNLDLEMYAVSYVKATLSGGTIEYKFSEPVISSATYMAQKEIESGKYNQETCDFIRQEFIDKVENTYTYTTEYYVREKDGYTLKSKVVSNSIYPLDTIVSADYDILMDGHTFDKDNPLNVLSSKIYANDKTTLKVYYSVATEVPAKISALDSNTEILQNVDHYATGDLIDKSGIVVTAVKNETESAQIIITPSADVNYYDVETFDLRDGSNYLSSINFTVYHEYYVEIKKAMGIYFPYSTGMYPDALIPIENAKSSGINTIKSSENQGVWIQFNIPENQPSGTYTGAFNVYLENSCYVVPVTVNVVDYIKSSEQKLLTKFGLSIDEIKSLEDVSNMSDEEFKIFAEEYYYQGLLDYGVNLGSLFSYNNERWSGTYWVGRPYNPDAILSFEQIYVDGGYHYAYEYPLVELDENGEMVVWTGGFKNGWGVNMNRVNDWLSQAIKYAKDDRVVMYQLPIIPGASVQFTAESLGLLYPEDGKGYGNYTEARRDLETGFRMNSVNLLNTRDVYEQIYLSSVENRVDLFKKGSFMCSWIDEYSNNASKLKVAQYITKIMKDFFIDLAEWIRIKHNVTDEFALSVIESISKIQLTSTGENTYDFDPETQWFAHCPGDGQYNSEKRRQEILEWANSVYDGEGIVWTYNGGYRIEDPATTTKTRGWWMYDYDVEADLQWAIMKDKYLDGISDDMVGKDVSDGDVIDSQDFYDIAVHYSAISGIGYMIYPGSPYNVKGFVPSIRLDSYRDAVEDYDLLYALERYYEKRAKDKGETYDGTGFDSIMDRLSERLYKGSRYKIHDGYENDYTVSRNSLLSMLVLAEKYGIIIENNVVGEQVVFTVSTPESINLIGYETKSTLNGFNVYTFIAGEKYFEFSFEGLTVRLSVSVISDGMLIDDLKWTDGENDTFKTYSEKIVNSTTRPLEVEKVSLNAANSVGGVSEGEYYKVSPKNQADWGLHMGFTLFPDHDKSYYEEYADITSLKFDVYFEITDELGNHPDKYRLFYYLGHSQNSQQLANEWFTIEIPMETVIERWDALTGTTNDTEYRVTGGNLFTLYGLHGGTALYSTFYIGNFRIEHN